jgi:integrase/recombinase XerD
MVTSFTGACTADKLSTTQIYAQVSVRALQAVHSATHPAAGNRPRIAHDGVDRKVAVSELLAALDEEADQEENRPDAGSPGSSR